MSNLIFGPGSGSHNCTLSDTVRPKKVGSAAMKAWKLPSTVFLLWLSACGPLVHSLPPSEERGVVSEGQQADFPTLESFGFLSGRRSLSISSSGQVSAA